MKPVKRTAQRWALSAVLVLAAGAAQAEFRTRVETGLTYASAPADFAAAAFGGDDYGGATGSLRLMWTGTLGEWDTEIHYRLDATAGNAAAVANALAGMSPPPPPYTLFDLSDTITSTDGLIASHAIDRLSIARATPKTVIRLGRQAVTWGAGQVFHPMDIVAPFAPQARDTEFKTGVDMAYLQLLFDDGSDLELIGVPRAAVQGGDITADASTLAARYSTFLGDLAANAILAGDHGDTTAGLGLSGALGGASWNAEWVPTVTADGTRYDSTLANISFAFPVAGRTALTFAEYFRNGFGVSGTGPALDSLPADLADRMARGQVFTVNRDYLALGMSFEVSPLVGASASTIINLADDSMLTAASLNWSVSDNANLMLGGQWPAGPRGTEFGGLPVSGGGAPYAGPERSAYLLYRQYF